MDAGGMMVGYVSIELDSPTLQDRRELILNHMEVILVQDELAGGFETLPYVTRKLLNRKEILRPSSEGFRRCLFPLGF